MKNLVLAFITLLIPLFGFNQNIGAGVSGLYNFQSESSGVGARVNVFPNSRISLIPQFSYYSIFLGTISEWTLGLGVEAKVIRTNQLNFYLLAHSGYNHWINASSSPLEGATTSNWNLEGGGGITTNGCLRPFIEQRYNFKFQESHLQVGLVYIFGCNNDERNINRKVSCPAYN